MIELLLLFVIIVTVAYTLYKLLSYDWSNFERDRNDLDDNMF